MIELLVLIIIATIGVVYTSSTGDAESTAMAEKTAKDALNEAEGQTGIGILGIDVVARKMRNIVGRSGGAVTADTLAEYRGAEADDFQDPKTAAPVKGADEDAFVFSQEKSHMPVAAAPAVSAKTSGSKGLDDLPARTQVNQAGSDGAFHGQAAADLDAFSDDTADLADDWDDDLDDVEDWDDAAAAQSYDNAFAGPAVKEPAPTPEKAAKAQAQSAAKPAAKPAPKSAQVLDTADAPMVDEFDPNLDQILIGYRPGEAGNGRIGIAEDPLRPGSAAVTLGGRCVAVVLDGFGKVRAHHIDLVCEEDEDIAA